MDDRHGWQAFPLFPVAMTGMEVNIVTGRHSQDMDLKSRQLSLPTLLVFFKILIPCFTAIPSCITAPTEQQALSLLSYCCCRRWADPWAFLLETMRTGRSIRYPKILRNLIDPRRSVAYTRYYLHVMYQAATLPTQPEPQLCLFIGFSKYVHWSQRLSLPVPLF